MGATVEAGVQERHRDLRTYMDAPCCQAFLSGFVSQEKIAANHSACVCDVRSRALMEYAGRRLITAADCRSPMFASG